MAEARRDRAVLIAWLAALFGLSALRDLRVLGAAALLSLVFLHRGGWRNLRRTAKSVVPITAGLSLLSLIVLRIAGGAWPAIEPYLALALRSAVMGFVTFSVLDRVQLMHALAPFPSLSRLLVVTLAQIHALRLVATESRDGLRSRMPRRPGVLDILKNAGGLTGMLFALAERNARDITDAMRSRGF